METRSVDLVQQSLFGDDDTQGYFPSLLLSISPLFLFKRKQEKTAKSRQQHGAHALWRGGPGIRWGRHQNDKNEKKNHSSGASKGGGGGGRLPPVAAADAARLSDT